MEFEKVLLIFCLLILFSIIIFLFISNFLLILKDKFVEFFQKEDLKGSKKLNEGILDLLSKEELSDITTLDDSDIIYNACEMNNLDILETNDQYITGNKDIQIDQNRIGQNLEKDKIESKYKKYKQDFKEIQRVFSQYRIDKLYHFTDNKNLPSIIKSEALLSWKSAALKNITPPCPGGNQLSRDLDERKRLGDYVRLCFAPFHPMLYSMQYNNRIGDYIWIEVSIKVALLKDTLFSNTNATSNDAIIGDSLLHFKNIDFDVLSGEYSSEYKKQFQAEVLVKSQIAAKYILNWDLLREKCPGVGRTIQCTCKGYNTNCYKCFGKGYYHPH